MSAQSNSLLTAGLWILLFPALAMSASVHPLFDVNTPAGAPFPSNRFAVSDATQNTGLRIALPKPDCATSPSECADLDVLNELDGFNLLPRLSIPFDGPIDLATVNSSNILLVSLGSTLPGGEPAGRRIGIDQVVWDPAGATLHVESDELLEQHARYALIVTKDVHDPGGKEIKAAKEFVDFADDNVIASTGDPVVDAYRTSVRGALSLLDSGGIVQRGRIVAASVFTTLSATANLEKIRDQVKVGTPAPAEFLLGTGGSRTVFPRGAVSGIVFRRQMSANPSAPLSNTNLSLAAIDVVPGAVGRIAFGRFSSPDYRVHPGEFIPQVGTSTGTGVAQGSSDVTFVLFLPSTPEPAGGYPVAIFGHGANGDKMTSTIVAAKLAESGLATIAIDAPGTGFGPVSAYALSFTDGTSTTLLSGGRSHDQNGDGRIINGEGGDAAPPRAMLGQNRDGQRQRAIDHMQLVRIIEVGMDLDGNGSADLDPSRIYYVGTSAGGRQGAILLALDANVRAGVLNAPNSAVEERLTSARDVLGTALQSRVPSLINSPGVASIDGISVVAPRFNENLPLRQGAPFSVNLEDGTSQTVRSPVVNTVPGALDIQLALERAEWAFQLANTVTYASCLRRHPLAGVPPKALIVQFAFGDRVIPNAATSSLLRAADLTDRATFFRNDLAFAVNPTPIPAAPNVYPHFFLQTFSNNAALTTVGLQVQGQIASFFALDGDSHILDPFDGTQITDPDLAGSIFEVPIVPPLPTRLNYPLSGSLAAVAPGATQLGPSPSNLLATSLKAWPLPYRGGTLRVSFAIDGSDRDGRSPAILDIFDLSGRRIRRIVGGDPLANGREFTWDGRSDRGDDAVPGVYFLRTVIGGRTAETKVIVFR